MMDIVLLVPLFLVTALQLALSAFLLLQVLVSRGSPAVTAGPARATTALPRVAVLTPAHDEAAGIAAGLRATLAQLGAGDRLIVIADNCSDDTADIARTLGAEVIERTDTSRRGKGFALDYALQYLRDDAPEVVVVVDADCLLAPGSLAVLAQACVDSGRPQQALDLMLRPPGADGLRARVSEFAWRVKNQGRPLGSMRLGLPCQLMGTGMAFPREALAQVSLATSSIVEDMQLGVELALRGYPVQFCPRARVTSVFPEGQRDASDQRRRWEHGHLGVITGAAPALLRDALRRRDTRLLGLGLDLSVPPLAFFALVQSLWLLLMTGYGRLAGAPGPAIVSGVSLCLLTVTFAVAWLRWGRDLISTRELLALPAYAVFKIPMYLAFWTGRQTAWVRARRP